MTKNLKNNKEIEGDAVRQDAGSVADAPESPVAAENSAREPEGNPHAERIVAALQRGQARGRWGKRGRGR